MDRRRAEAFQLLGIPADSDVDAVSHAYRQLARATHPDVSADPEAAGRFAALAAAYRLASRAAGSSGGSVSADGVRVRSEGLAGGSELFDGAPAFDERLRRCAVPSWSMWWGPTPPRRARDGAPIVAGPVFISPTRRGGEEAAGDG